MNPASEEATGAAVGAAAGAAAAGAFAAGAGSDAPPQATTMLRSNIIGTNSSAVGTPGQFNFMVRILQYLYSAVSKLTLLRICSAYSPQAKKALQNSTAVELILRIALCQDGQSTFSQLIQNTD